MLNGRYVPESEKQVSWQRRQINIPRLGTEVFVGCGVDVGCGPALRGAGFWWDRFSGITTVLRWDRDHGDPPCRGDAHELASIGDGMLDWVFASHILEHLDHPEIALTNWLRVLRPGGHLFLSVPHRDLYEQRATLPSRWAPEHKRFYLPYAAEPPDTIGLYGWLAMQQYPLVPPTMIGSVVFRELAFHIDYLATGDWGHQHSTGPGGHPQGEYCIDALLQKVAR